MATSVPNLEELDSEAQLALAAGKSATAAVQRAQLLKWMGHAFWRFTRRYWAMLSIVERAVDSGEFEPEKYKTLHARILPLEHMADDILAAGRGRDYFNITSTAAPLLSLQECNERIKDCMVAVESMLEPRLDDIMAAALDKHRSGKTIPLDSIS